MICSVEFALDGAARALAAAGVENPRLEARLLLAHALGIEQEALLRDRKARVDASGLGALLSRRLRREPLAFLLGRREFWGLTLASSPETLVPRPDSETLIAAALAARPDRPAVRSVLDLGTGTGCLLLAALTEFAAAFGVGIDIRPAAVALARRNAGMLGLQNRCAFAAGDWAGGVAGRFDLILCNPPYIRSGAIAMLAPEIAIHEPRSALDGGADGLSAYRRLIPDLARLLAPAGAAALELGEGQADAVVALGRAAGLDPVALHADLGGIVRVVVFRPAAAPKKHLADGQEAVSFPRHGRDRCESADPDAPAGPNVP